MPFFLPLGVLSGFSSAIPYVGPLVEGSHHPCSRSGNALLGWYLAGLDFQVEHHLFPRVCHLHYPALSRIVEETCSAHRVQYRCEPTLRSALAANVRWLRRMGSASALDVKTSPGRSSSLRALQRTLPQARRSLGNDGR